MALRTPEAIWKDCCNASVDIRAQYGLRAAIDYVVGDKLMMFAQTGGGVVGVNQGLILSGGAQGGYSPQDAPSGFSTVSTLGGEVIATAGEGFGAGASASTDGSGLNVDALGSGSFATGVGLVSGANYQTGLAVATPSLCP